MPWNWQGRGQDSVQSGGSKGTYQEASVAHAWPDYEAQYLAKRLTDGGGKYENHMGLATNTDAAAYVYFDKISEDYKQEADECLKQEFHNWLNGMHEDNEKRDPYPDADTCKENSLPVRKAVFKEYYKRKGRENVEIPSEPLKQEWRPTWWGKQSLVHLPGVREYMYNMKQKATEAEFKMNLLAETGPQDLESAWVYFKHWVKKRPVAPEVCVSLPGNWARPPPSDGNMVPNTMHGWRSSQFAKNKDGTRRGIMNTLGGEAMIPNAKAPKTTISEVITDAVDKAALPSDNESNNLSDVAEPKDNSNFEEMMRANIDETMRNFERQIALYEASQGPIAIPPNLVPPKTPTQQAGSSNDPFTPGNDTEVDESYKPITTPKSAGAAARTVQNLKLLSTPHEMYEPYIKYLEKRDGELYPQNRPADEVYGANWSSEALQQEHNTINSALLDLSELRVSFNQEINKNLDDNNGKIGTFNEAKLAALITAISNVQSKIIDQMHIFTRADNPAARVATLEDLMEIDKSLEAMKETYTKLKIGEQWAREIANLNDYDAQLQVAQSSFEKRLTKRAIIL